MKKLFYFLVLLLSSPAFKSNAQIFWVENFESGSMSGLVASSYTGPNGTWTLTSTGINDASANIWYVSCAENGHTGGYCGTSCAPVTLTATLATLHVGATADGGASYDAGGLCPIICVNTNMRAESPTINCSAKTGITAHFYYIEDGDGTNDDATMWYYDGTTWSLLLNTAKTPPICPGGQGMWTYQSIALPTSANHNPNVKLGFNWTNNDDGAGTDPSFAVDSLYLTTSAGATPVASFTSTATSACTDSCITFTSTSTSSGTIDSIRWVAVYLGAPVYLLSTTNPYTLCNVPPALPAGSYGMRLRVYSGGVYDSATMPITIKTSPSPVITKTGSVLSVASTYTSYQWSNSSGPITGATTNSYTYTTLGKYSVLVDSGGCQTLASINLSALGLSTINDVSNSYWVSPLAGNTISLHAAHFLDDALNINIFDATGRQIYNDSWSLGDDAKLITGLSLSPGLYMIRLSNSNTSVVLKLMK